MKYRRRVAASVCCLLLACYAVPGESVTKFGDPLAAFRVFFETKGWVALQVLSGHYAVGTVIMPKNQEIKVRADNCFPKLRSRPGVSRPAALEEIIREGGTYEASVGLALLKSLVRGFEASVEGANRIHIGFENLTHEAVDIIDLTKTIAPECEKVLNRFKGAVIISEILNAKIIFTFLGSDGGRVRVDLTALAKRFPLNVDLRGKLEQRDSSRLITKEHLNVAYKALQVAFDDKGRMTVARVEAQQLRPSHYGVEIWVRNPRSEAGGG